MELEEELSARIFLHKMAITGGALAKDYIKHILNGNVKLPYAQVMDMAGDYSTGIIQKALEEDTFDALYEKAWDKLKGVLPKNYRITMHT